MAFSPGERLGPYEILALIGKGGMGEVYRARDPRLKRDVAIKVSAEQFTERFEREAQAIGALNHPHICQIYDVGPNYLVMEYIEGTSLKGPLSVEKSLEYAGQVASALSTAHAKGITHRDLKPANIMVTGSGIKLLDFGLAQFSRATKDISSKPADATATVDMTQAGTILGTAAYMSPEQAEAKVVDARSDIFSFGSVLYEMLSGHRAFTGDSAVGVMARILHKEPDRIDAPAALQTILSRCLQKLPADRFQSMGEVRAGLQQAIVQTSAKGADQQPSIAVLPFVNMSADKDNEYFSDGLAEEILNLLAKIPRLKVIARTSSFSFRGKEQDIRKTAEMLGVSHVLEGSVRRSGNRIRVTAQLIHALDGSHLWSERYDRDMTDVFAVQDEIGQAISEALQVRLAPRARVVNVEAYENYLKGHYYRLRFTLKSMAKGKECFEQALAIDPQYAQAYSGLAAYYYTLAVLAMKPAGAMLPLAKAAAEKALAIDPASSEAHSVLATVAGIFDYDWIVAETHHRKAMAAEPVPAMARFRHALYYLLPLGRFADALEQSRLALETDPLSPNLNYCVALCLSRTKRYQESIAYARRALEIDANFYFAWCGMGLAQYAEGLIEEAIASFQRVVEMAPWFSTGAWWLAAAYHRSGDREHPQELARDLAGSHGRTSGAAAYYAATGETDAMFAAFDGAYQERDPLLASAPNDPFFDSYRADLRFQALLAKMNLA
jgi:eukaryotic-like serine/threonine-protein kinase